MSADTYLQRIVLAQVDDVDLICLQKSLAKCYYGVKVEDILEGLRDSRYQVWRGGHQGKRFVVVTEVYHHRGGEELHISYVGGWGYLKAMDTVFAELKQFAYSRNCLWLSAYSRKGFERFLHRFNPLCSFTHWAVRI